jgi:hypothetical protein
MESDVFCATSLVRVTGMQIGSDDGPVGGGNGNGADVGFLRGVIHFGSPEFNLPHDAIVSASHGHFGSPERECFQ